MLGGHAGKGGDFTAVAAMFFLLLKPDFHGSVGAIQLLLPSDEGEIGAVSSGTLVKCGMTCVGVV